MDRWNSSLRALVFGLALTGAVAQGADAPAKNNPKETFLALLKAHKKVKDCYPRLAPEELDVMQHVDAAVVSNLPDALLQARYRAFNVEFLQRDSLLTTKERQLAEKKKELENTPLSDTKNYNLRDAAVRALSSAVEQTRLTLCLQSAQANLDVFEAIKTLPADKRKRETKAAAVAAPKLPGVAGPSRLERLKQAEAEKYFLYPVDDEFYKTQLGKKLEKDLGGRADYWSYDYGANDLYVKVGGEVGKLSIKDEGGGTKFIRTRVGNDFLDPRGTDTKVDNTTAQGRFLNPENTREESLFGAFTKQEQKYAPELPAGHSDHDGHNHAH